MRGRINPRFAFDVCHEVYLAAREVVDNRLSTTQLETSGKYIWRPDLRPRLVEYVSDFALAGQRALEGHGRRKANADSSPAMKPGGFGMTASRIGRAAKVSEAVPLLRCHSERARRHLAGDEESAFRGNRQRASKRPELRASRMVLFRLHFLGGAEYESARRLLGISELTWADWAEEIRQRVGRELIRSRVFPPSRYFKAPSSRM